MLTFADEAGLRVIVQIYTDAAPEWLGTRYPDSSFVTDQGARIGSQASPGYCLDHAGVRSDMVAFIGAVSTAAARHSSFYAVDVWSEPHVVNWVWFNTPVEFCYCPHTQARFREWLKRKYRTLDAVNSAWYRTFSSWDEVEAPRFGTILSYTDFIDWKTFIAAKLEEDLKLKADASAPRGARPVSSHSDAPAIMLSPLSGFGNPDDWWMTRAVDYYGTSIYPKHAAAADAVVTGAADVRTRWNTLRLRRSRVVDRRAASGARCDGRAGCHAGDRGGPSSVGMGGDFPRRPRHQLLRLVSHELRLRVERVRNDRSRRHDYRSRANRRRVRRSRGPERRIVCSASPPSVTRSHPLQPAFISGRRKHGAPGAVVRNSMLGIYRALFEQNIQVDFIHPDDVVAGAASKYQVVYLSYPLMLSQPVADALKAYVRGGGTLISEARPAWNDERGIANTRIPGGGLDQTFGARERELRSADNVAFTMESNLEGPLAALGGRAFNGVAFAEHLEVFGSGARVLARFAGDTGRPGDPAIVMTPQGAGRAILIGTFPSAAFEQDPDKMRGTGELLQRIIASAGIRRRSESKAAQVGSRHASSNRRTRSW